MGSTKPKELPSPSGVPPSPGAIAELLGIDRIRRRKKMALPITPGDSKYDDYRRGGPEDDDDYDVHRSSRSLLGKKNPRHDHDQEDYPEVHPDMDMGQPKHGRDDGDNDNDRNLIKMRLARSKKKNGQISNDDSDGRPSSPENVAIDAMEQEPSHNPANRNVSGSSDEGGTGGPNRRGFLGRRRHGKQGSSSSPESPQENRDTVKNKHEKKGLFGRRRNKKESSNAGNMDEDMTERTFGEEKIANMSPSEQRDNNHTRNAAPGRINRVYPKSTMYGTPFQFELNPGTDRGQQLYMQGSERLALPRLWDGRADGLTQLIQCLDTRSSLICADVGILLIPTLVKSSGSEGGGRLVTRNLLQDHNRLKSEDVITSVLNRVKTTADDTATPRERFAARQGMIRDSMLYLCLQASVDPMVIESLPPISPALPSELRRSGVYLLYRLLQINNPSSNLHSPMALQAMKDSLDRTSLVQKAVELKNPEAFNRWLQQQTQLLQNNGIKPPDGLALHLLDAYAVMPGGPAWQHFCHNMTSAVWTGEKSPPSVEYLMERTATVYQHLDACSRWNGSNDLLYPLAYGGASEAWSPPLSSSHHGGHFRLPARSGTRGGY